MDSLSSLVQSDDVVCLLLKTKIANQKGVENRVCYANALFHLS